VAGEKPPAEECKCEKGAPKWVVTFGDMMSLLLTFFVLLLSFSTTDIKKYRRMVGSVKEAFGVAATSPDHVTPSGPEITVQQIEIPHTLAMMTSVRAKAARNARKNPEVDLESGADWFRLSVEGDALFDPGAYRLKPEAREILAEMADIINEFDGEVKIEGHTDNARGWDSRFEDESGQANLELAGLRAIAVLDHFFRNHNVDREKMIPVSHGELKPRDTNATEEGRRRNRRVEFELRAGSRSRLGDSESGFIRP